MLSFGCDSLQIVLITCRVRPKKIEAERYQGSECRPYAQAAEFHF